MNNNKISIGTVQFAVNAENNSHLLIEHPLGSVSRMISELLSQRLNYLGFDSDVAKLIVTKPEEKGHKQLIYTSMLPLETARRILETRYFDYCLYGEINFDNQLKVEISLLDSNEDKNLWRREITSKHNNFSVIVKRVIEEVVRILKLETEISKINFLEKYSTNSLEAWGWFSVGFEDELGINDCIYALKKAIEIAPDFIEAKLKLISYQLNINSLKTSDPVSGFINRDELVEAVKSLEELKASGIDNEIFKYYADTLFNQGKYLESEYFYKVVNSYEDNTDILLKLLKISFEKKDNNFEYYLNKYLENKNHEELDYPQIGYFLINKGENQKAMAIATQGLKNNPDSAKIYSMLGFINMSQNNFEEAVKNYEKSFSLGFNENILEDWSSSLLKLNKFQDVINIIEKYKNDLPYNSGIECNLAIAYLNTDNEIEGTKVLEKAVKKDLTNARANALLGNIYFRKKSYARAQKYLSIAINTEPENYNWHKSLGDLFYDSGDIQEAIKYYEKAIELLPTLKIARYICYQADNFKAENKFQEAFNMYNKSYKLEPDFLKPLLEMGNLCILTEDLEKAIELFEKAVERFPNESEAWHKLSEVYFEKSRGFFKKSWKTKAEEAQKKYESLIDNQDKK